MNFKRTILSTGLTLLTVPFSDSPSVTVLVIVSAGSKYETKAQNGVSHFLEHMCFKGTTKRPRVIDIALELDSIGSQSNAFTSQEFTGYYAKSHPSHLSTILDVVSDLYQNPVFDENEIEKEKGVIVEEINMYEDMPHKIVHDVFMEALYGDQPAGWNVAGTKENVLSITRQNLLEYRAAHYVASATTVIIAGTFDESLIQAEVEKSFEHIPVTPHTDKIPVVEIQNVPIIKIKHKKTDQTHIVLGLRSYKAVDPRNIPLQVFSSILGGGMSSRLFQKLREEMGVGYYVRAGEDEYTDHGYMAVSTGVDTSRVSEVVAAILDELKKLRDEKVEESELEKTKQYLIGNMYLGLESSDSLAEYYAVEHILTPDHVLTPDELALEIKKVTVEDVYAVAQDIVLDARLCMAVVGNIKDEEELKNMFHF